jgi:hypothetical protein
MKIILIINSILLLIYISNSLIVLPPYEELSKVKLEFNLNQSDLRHIKYHFLKKKNQTHPYTIDKVRFNKKIIKFITIVNDQNHPKWIKAYLYLLEIIPDLKLENEDC